MQIVKHERNLIIASIGFKIKTLRKKINFLQKDLEGMVNSLEKTRRVIDGDVNYE